VESPAIRLKSGWDKRIPRSEIAEREGQAPFLQFCENGLRDETQGAGSGRGNFAEAGRKLQRSGKSVGTKQAATGAEASTNKTRNVPGRSPRGLRWHASLREFV